MRIVVLVCSVLCLALESLVFGKTTTEVLKTGHKKAHKFLETKKNKTTEGLVTAEDLSRPFIGNYDPYGRQYVGGSFRRISQFGGMRGGLRGSFGGMPQVGGFGNSFEQIPQLQEIGRSFGGLTQFGGVRGVFGGMPQIRGTGGSLGGPSGEMNTIRSHNSGRNQFTKGFGSRGLKDYLGYDNHFSNERNRRGHFNRGRTRALAKEKTIALDHNFGTGEQHQYNARRTGREGFRHHDRYNDYGRLNRFGQHEIQSSRRNPMRPGLLGQSFV